ncbi:MAG: FIST C-terminal domain-containing protein [Bacteroidetes bacterium]|nr:FIST C-terminal domain-containing protein [Bacteroidota bacterium]
MKAKSIKGKSTEEIKTALQVAMSDNFKPTLAIAFVSIYQNRKEIAKLFNDNNIAVFGATTNGSFIGEEIERQGASIVLLDVNPDYFSIIVEEYPNRNYREVAAMVARKALEKFVNPAFLIAGSHVKTDAEALLFGFEDAVGRNVNIHGCMAGDDFTFSEQFVFTNDKETNEGLLTLVFNQDKMNIAGCATCGWKAVGTVRTVTKSEGNHVYTVDDIPVLDLTAKYGGLELKEKEDFSVEVAAQFPLQMQREKGDPVMRPGLLIDWNDHSFYCSGTVPEGSKIRFSLPPDFDVVEKVVQSCESLKASNIPEADAVIVFSCAGRFIALGPLINQEIEGIKNVWNVPMAGMFSNAELARATGGNLEMHNCTACVVAMKEK